MEAEAQKPAIELLPLAREKVQHENLRDTLSVTDSLVQYQGEEDSPGGADPSCGADPPGGADPEKRTPGEGRTEPAEENTKSAAYPQGLRKLLFIRPIILYNRSPH